MSLATDSKDDLLMKYLFNELPTSENEKLEDQMALDEELSERIQALEMIMIDRYVSGTMTPGEISRFENGFLLFPENLQKVREASIFHESLRQLRNEGRAEQS
jgi:hypothetical protein